MKSRFDIDYDSLYDLYIEQNLSLTEIGQKFNVSRDIIYNKVKSYNIKKDKQTSMKCRQRIAEATNLKKYGVKNVSQCPEIHQRKIDACRKHFGTDYPSQSDNWKIKTNKHYQELFGCDWNTQRADFWDIVDKDSWLNHQWQTKRKNNSFNKSSIEDDYYQLLLTEFNEDDIIRQYSDDRYPFKCDFYIKSLDLFIEVNYWWHHGPHPFHENDYNDIKLLEQLKQKSKNSKSYIEAVRIWSLYDPLKLKTAKDNNLNYKMIYPEGEFYE